MVLTYCVIERLFIDDDDNDDDDHVDVNVDVDVDVDVQRPDIVGSSPPCTQSLAATPP